MSWGLGSVLPGDPRGSGERRRCRRRLGGEGAGPGLEWVWGFSPESGNLETRCPLPTGWGSGEAGAWGFQPGGGGRLLSPHPSLSSGTIYSLAFSSPVGVLGPWSRSELPGTQFSCLGNGIKMPANWPRGTGEQDKRLQEVSCEIGEGMKKDILVTTATAVGSVSKSCGPASRQTQNLPPSLSHWPARRSRPILSGLGVPALAHTPFPLTVARSHLGMPESGHIPPLLKNPP